MKQIVLTLLMLMTLLVSGCLGAGAAAPAPTPPAVSPTVVAADEPAEATPRDEAAEPGAIPTAVRSEEDPLGVAAAPHQRDPEAAALTPKPTANLPFLQLATPDPSAPAFDCGPKAHAAAVAPPSGQAEDWFTVQADGFQPGEPVTLLLRYSHAEQMRVAIADLVERTTADADGRVAITRQLREARPPTPSGSYRMLNGGWRLALIGASGARACAVYWVTP